MHFGKLCITSRMVQTSTTQYKGVKCRQFPPHSYMVTNNVDEKIFHKKNSLFLHLIIIRWGYRICGCWWGNIKSYQTCPLNERLAYFVMSQREPWITSYGNIRLNMSELFIHILQNLYCLQKPWGKTTFTQDRACDMVERTGESVKDPDTSENPIIL